MSLIKPCASHLGPPSQPLDKPASADVAPFVAWDIDVFETAIDNLGLVSLPVRDDGTVVDWTASLREAWGAMTEEAAHGAMRGFVHSGLARFEYQRHRADNPDNNSRLSPYLRHGLLKRAFWLAT